MEYEDKLMGVTITKDEIPALVDICKYMMTGGDVDKLGMERYVTAKILARKIIDLLDQE